MSRQTRILEGVMRRRASVAVKRCLSCLLAAAVLASAVPETGKAQGGFGEAVAATKGVIDGVRLVTGNWQKVKWFLGGMKHTWWACIYQDGLTVYNNPRSYRTPTDVLNYFMGGGGDCDAFYYDARGSQQHLCYSNPYFAQQYTAQHGQIVDLTYQDGHQQWHSVLHP